MSEFSTATEATPDISVVVTVYNELDGLEICLAEVREVLEASGRTWEIVFTDDHSADRSLAKLLEFPKRDPRIVVVEHTRNLGQIRANLSGLRHSRGRVVIPLDPDLQFHPDCIPLLATQVLDKGYDFAGGIRTKRADNLMNRITGAVSSRIINWIMGIEQKDFGCVKAYSRRIVESILLMDPDFLVIQAAAYALSKSFVELPIRHQARAIGESKWSFFMRLNFFVNVYATYSRFPFTAIQTAGFALFTASAVLFLPALFAAFFGAGPLGRGLATFLALDGLALVCGTNLVVLSLVGQCAVRAMRRNVRQAEDAIIHVHRAGG